MKKRLILGGLGVMAILVGLATFAANTAQWVNVTARLEKEIEVACVVVDEDDLDEDGLTTDYIVDPDNCDYGVTFPENIHEKVVEVALSNSFYNQDVKSDVLYDVLWECKLVDEQALPQPDPDEPGYNPCREDLLNDTLVYDEGEGKWVHEDPLKLDGNIRDYVNVGASETCLDPDIDEPGSGFSDGGDGKLEYIGSGIVDDVSVPKCFYHLVFSPPACEGHVNLLTDPGSNPKTVECHEVTTSLDPQEWDRFANLGDNFKIQVYAFSFD
jgi:hypothetical protein